MERGHLSLLSRSDFRELSASFSEMLDDHHRLLEGFLDTHVTQNHSERTLEGERRFLTGWFQGFSVQDAQHPDGERQLLAWEAMTPVHGRARIQEFSKGLVLAGLKPRTVQGYLGCLRRFFAYILEWPYLPGPDAVPIAAKYGRIEQPVLECDYPVHSVDQDDTDFVLTGSQLYQFYEFVRADYPRRLQKKHPAQRDYTMIVVAGESGLRADEIAHLDALGPDRDIFYPEHCLRTRYGKATNGSGKRPRSTILTPFAAATLQVYEQQVRPQFANSAREPALFLTETGTRIEYRAMWRQLHCIGQAARSAKLDLPSKFSWHSLRKSFATSFMERHPDKIWVLMDLMGHINPGTLHRYVKHSRSYYERVLNGLVAEFMPTLPHHPRGGH